jgi:RNA polymerase sigma-70 factor (ECF subfamily)
MPEHVAQPSWPAGSARFATTHWSLVAAAGHQALPQARDALAALCTAYWYPLYCFVLRQGHDAPAAQDLTQEFFARLLEKDYLQAAERGRGKFRTFLLTCLRHFLANEHDRARAQKRGGGHSLLTLDFAAAEARVTGELCHDLTPERLFERRWALTLLEQVLGRLREEFTSAGNAVQFDALKSYLTADSPAASYAAVAERLGMSEGAVKVSVHRLRKRYRELLREEIGRTVDDPVQIDAEIRDLFAALG